MDNHNDFYKKLVDNLYDGVYFVDRERVITYWKQRRRADHGVHRLSNRRAGLPG